MVARDIGVILIAIFSLLNIGLIASGIYLIIVDQQNQKTIQANCTVVDHLIEPKDYGWDGYVLFNIQNINVTKCVINGWDHKKVEWVLQKNYQIGSNITCYHKPDYPENISFKLEDLGDTKAFCLIVILLDIIFLDLKLIFKMMWRNISYFIIPFCLLGLITFCLSL